MAWTLHKKTFDPVCGKRITPMSSDIAAVHERHLFYFCSQHCRSAFLETPADFVATGPASKKSWWGRYLKRVEKTTGGKPPCCH